MKVVIDMNRRGFLSTAVAVCCLPQNRARGQNATSTHDSAEVVLPPGVEVSVRCRQNNVPANSEAMPSIMVDGSHLLATCGSKKSRRAMNYRFSTYRTDQDWRTEEVRGRPLRSDTLWRYLRVICRSGEPQHRPATLDGISGWTLSCPGIRT